MSKYLFLAILLAFSCTFEIVASEWCAMVAKYSLMTTFGTTTVVSAKKIYDKLMKYGECETNLQKLADQEIDYEEFKIHQKKLDNELKNAHHELLVYGLAAIFSLIGTVDMYGKL